MNSIQVKQTKDQRFKFFNFHHDELLGMIYNWMQSVVGNPLLLEGKNGVGRKYSVEATNYLTEANFKVIAINIAMLDQPLDTLEPLLTKQDWLTDLQLKLWDEIKQHTKNTQVQNDSSEVGWAIVAHLGLAVSLGGLVWDFFRNINKATFQLAPDDHIADLIRAICQKHSLILHLDNAESSPDTTEMFLRISKRHNVAARASAQLKPCLLVINCRDSRSFANNFALDSEFSSFRFEPLRLSDLQNVLPNRNVHLSNDVLKLLMAHGDHKQLSIYPHQLESQLIRLQQNKLLVQKNKHYDVKKEASNQDILHIIGRPLTDHYDNQIKSIENPDLRQQVKDYMGLASLCGTHYIPQIPLLYGLSLDYYRNDADRERGDLILDTIEDLFSEMQPVLLTQSHGVINDVEYNPLYCYRFIHPIVQDHIIYSLNDEKTNRAEKLLGELSILLPHRNSARNALLWHLAQIVGGNEKERWFELLYFDLMKDEVETYKSLLEERISEDQGTSYNILNYAKRQTHFPAFVAYLEVTLDVCQSYLPPTHETAALLHDIGVIFRKRSKYNIAIECFESELEILKALRLLIGNGNSRRGVVCLESELEIASFMINIETEASALNSMVVAFQGLSDYSVAQSYLEQSLLLFLMCEDKAGHAATLGNIASNYSHNGDYETALKYLQQSLALRKEVGDTHGESIALNNISQIYDAWGDYETALKYLQQALVIQQETGDKYGEGDTLHNMASIALGRGDYEIAFGYLQESLSIRQEIGHKSGEAVTLNNISQIYRARNDNDTTIKFLKRALAIQQEIGDRSGEGTTLGNMAEMAHYCGDYETAIKFSRQALNIQQEIGDKHGEGNTLNTMAATAQYRGDHETAYQYLQQSLAIRQEIGDKYGEGTTLNNISQVYVSRGDYETAIQYLQQSLAIEQETGNKYGEGITLNNIASIYSDRGDYETALEYLQQARVIQQEIGNKSAEGISLNNIANIHDAWGDYETAFKYLQQARVIQQDIDDVVQLSKTIFNIGGNYWQKSQQKEAYESWSEAYRIAKKSGNSEVLDDLKNLSEQLLLPDGLQSWETKLNESDEEVLLKAITTRTFEHTDNQVNRNAACPCGSGKKFKQCHGRLK